MQSHMMIFALAMLASVTVTAMGSATCLPTWLSQIRTGEVHHFNPVNNHILSCGIYHNATSSSQLTCAIFCFQDNLCKSFNFCQNERLCELSSAKYAVEEYPLQSSIGCIYFDEEIHDMASVSSIKLCATYDAGPGVSTTVYTTTVPEQIHFTVQTSGNVRMTAAITGGYHYVELTPLDGKIAIWGDTRWANRTTLLHQDIELGGCSHYWVSFNNSQVSFGKYGSKDSTLTLHDSYFASNDVLVYGTISVWNQAETVWKFYDESC